MAVRAKMQCVGNKVADWAKTYPPNEQARDVVLQAVYSDDPQDPNHSWSKATPCGQVLMTITNPAAFDQFEVGKTYFVDFTPAE